MVGEIEIKVKKFVDVKGGMVIVFKVKDVVVLVGMFEIVLVDVLVCVEKVVDFKFV